MTNPTADLLRSALALIEQPERWTKGAYVTADGTPAAWCMQGACIAASQRHHATLARAHVAILAVINSNSIVRWNDAPERTHAEVVAAFRSAIAIAEGGV